MSPKTFLEKFDLIADAPGAVAKMRELILELAIHGSLHSSGKSYTSNPSTPFAIPNDWRWLALNEAADCRAAAKVEASSLKDSDWVLDLEDIDGGAGKVITTATFAERRSLSTKASFQKGDILYGKLRPYLNKVVIANGPGFCTTEIIPLRPQPFTEAGYLRLFLRSPHFLRYAADKNYGMKMPRLGTKDLEATQIPLPPLAEQKRIVAKVDELMALCDRLEQQQNEREAQHTALSRASLTRFSEAPTPENLEYLFHPTYTTTPADLRKTILTLAVQGKLVPQVSTEIIDRDFIDELTPEDLPPSWRYLNFGKWCDIQGGNQPPKSQFIDKPKDEYVRLLQIRDLGDKEVPTYIPINSTNRFCKEGELMIGRYGASVGKIFWAKEGAYNVALAKFIYPPKAYLARFAFLALQSDFFQCKMVGASRSAQAGFNKGDLADINLPLPPLAEQKRIVAKVDELMKLVDQLEAQLTTARATAENLLNALLADLTLNAQA